MTTPLVDVTQHDCPSCTRLVCTDWRTCPGYLRDLVARLDTGADRIDSDRLFRDDRADSGMTTKQQRRRTNLRTHALTPKWWRRMPASQFGAAERARRRAADKRARASRRRNRP